MGVNIQRQKVPDRLIGNCATVLHCYNPIDPFDREMFKCANGLTLRDLAPVTDLPVACVIENEYIHPADWEFVEPTEGDHVRFMILPQGGGGSGNSLQTVLGIVLIVVGIIADFNPQLIAAGIGLLASGLIPVPDTVPISTPKIGQETSPTYSINLAGNTARLGQAIPVPYGRHIIIPDFAANPYNEFDSANNQTYHALFCFGLADKTVVEAVTIDDTVLEHFIDVQTQYVGPGFDPVLTLIDPAVVNAPEVSNAELNFGQYVGPFASSGAGLLTHKIAIDIVCPKGLYFADDNGDLTSKTVSWLVEARPINDAGAVAGIWFALGFESLTAAQSNPVRRSYNYEVTPGRYEIRVQRQDVRDESARAAHDLVWSGLRSYLQVDTPLEPNANYLAVKIKATNQLSGLSQRKFAIIQRRMLPTWNPIGGWSPEVETRNIAWALADVLRNPIYGSNYPDSRIDLETLYGLSQVWEARGDTFNGVFDERITIWEALTRIARCGRARPVMRGNVITFVRDEPQVLEAALFNMRNIKRGSFNVSYKIPDNEDPDGLILEYFNEVTWSTDFITMPLPTVTGDPLRPARTSFKGITNKKQAQRECAYTVADMAYRPNTVNFVTEMEGYLPALGDLVAVAHDLGGVGISGDIESWDGSQAVCSEDLAWGIGNHYALLADKYGDAHGPYHVVPGSLPRSMLFVDAPDFTPYTGTEYERTRFSMGLGTAYAKQCRILGLFPAEDDSVGISVVVEDDRVHTADQPYIGDGNIGGGGIGGAGGGTRVAHYAPSGIPRYNAASDAQRVRYGFYTKADRTVGTINDDGYVYDN